jgi:hypothetical protein
VDALVHRLDAVDARFEDPRLLLTLDYIPGESQRPPELVTRERLRADGTRRPYSARTPPGWRHDNEGDVERKS